MHKGCAAQSGYSDLRDDFPDMNQMTRNGDGWRDFADRGDLTSMAFTFGRDNCLAFEKSGPATFGGMYNFWCRKD